MSGTGLFSYCQTGLSLWHGIKQKKRGLLSVPASGYVYKPPSLRQGLPQFSYTRSQLGATVAKVRLRQSTQCPSHRETTMHLSTHNCTRAELLERTLARIKSLGYEDIETSG